MGFRLKYIRCIDLHVRVCHVRGNYGRVVLSSVALEKRLSEKYAQNEGSSDLFLTLCGHHEVVPIAHTKVQRFSLKKTRQISLTDAKRNYICTMLFGLTHTLYTSLFPSHTRVSSSSRPIPRMLHKFG